MEFTPVHNGHTMRSVLFSCVLHVPDLNQNLLSVLTLTEGHAFCTVIESGTMQFIMDALASTLQWELLELPGLVGAL